LIESGEQLSGGMMQLLFLLQLPSWVKSVLHRIMKFIGRMDRMSAVLRNAEIRDNSSYEALLQKRKAFAYKISGKW